MKRIFALFLALFLLAGCSRQATRLPAPGSTQPLRVGTLLPEAVYGPLVLEFENRTGIFVEVAVGDLDSLLNDDGIDCLFGIHTPALEENADSFLPLTMDRKLAVGIVSGDTWVPFSVNQLVLAYHTRLVRSPLPSSLKELSDPIWSGQIAMAAPISAGLSEEDLIRLSGTPTRNTLEAFRSNISTRTATCAQAVDLVAQGKLSLAIVTDDEVLNRPAVTSLSYIPLEGGKMYITTGAAQLRSAPHPENAAQFLAFLLEPGVQNYLQTQLHLGSVLWELSTLGPKATIQNPIWGKELRP